MNVLYLYPSYPPCLRVGGNTVGRGNYEVVFRGVRIKIVSEIIKKSFNKVLGKGIAVGIINDFHKSTA
jgi:hypothetical protein